MSTTIRPIPDLDDPAAVFGSASHLPAMKDLPREFQEERGPFCDAVSDWFFGGARTEAGGRRLVIKSRTFVAKPGVDAPKALHAIKAALGSFAPKHKHKIAGCGFLLSEWFDLEPKA